MLGFRNSLTSVLFFVGFISCNLFASDYGQWCGIQEFPKEQRDKIVSTCRTLFVGHRHLLDSGKSRNIATVKLDPAAEISFVSGLLPIPEKIKTSFKNDVNPCYDFCDVLLGIDKSANVRRLIDYFLSEDLPKALTAIKTQKILTKANSGLDFSKVSSSSDLFSISTYLKQIKFFSAPEETERTKIIRFADDVYSKSQDLRVLLVEYSSVMERYLAFLNTLNVPAINAKLVEATAQAKKLSSILPSCINVEMTLDTFESAAFVGQITPFLHSETLLAYAIVNEHAPMLPFVDILRHYYASEQQFVLSTKRDMCPVCESILLTLAKNRSPENSSRALVVVSTEEHERSWERDSINHSLLKIPLDTSVLKDFQAITEASVARQIKQSSIPIYKRISSTRGLSLFFGRRTPDPSATEVVSGYISPFPALKTYFQNLDGLSETAKLDAEDVYFLASYFLMLRRLVEDYQAIVVNGVILGASSVVENTNKAITELEHKIGISVVPNIKDKMILRIGYMSRVLLPFLQTMQP